MEVVLSEPLRRGAPLPLSQLVEESRSQTSIPNPLLQSKIYDKLKGNALIQAEPSELHFSGFELGKEYLKLLKLINVSSEVMNIHIIPTQTKHFQTTYTKKYRLIPGLAYTVKVAFCPNEWRYFYDCIRVHCRGEENLLIPVHAYPVIDDLRIPSRVHLPAVPIGQSVGHTLWLRCSCPIDFEFQVYVIQAHQAFSVHPPSGVIPANGEAKVTVTFTPVEYETCQIIIQLVVSQFNTKPFLCTITGFSAPQLALSQQERKAISEGEASLGLSRVPPAAPPPPRGKPRPPENHRLNNNRLKTVGNPSVVKLPVDVCTPAGVAKMLIRDQHKLSSNGLKEAVRSGSVSALQSREMKAALFLKKVQKKVKEEQTNQLKWQVRLGEDPLSESSRRQILEQREVFLHEYMVKMEDVRLEEDFAVRKPRLSCRRPLREAGQSPDGVPAFQFYTSFHWELRQRPLRRFQQAARKVVLRHRLEKILASLKQLKTFDWKDEESTWDIPPDRVSPSSLRFYTRDDDPLTPVSLEPLPVDPMVSTIKTQVPTFALQVPPHYEVMGCKPASICRAVTPNIPPTPMRPLHTNPPIKPHVASRLAEEEEDEEEEEEDEEEEQQQEGGVASVSFSLPEALLKPFPANRLRIFNPAPGLQVYRSTPTILQTTLESQLRPLTRYIVPERNLCATKTSTEQKIQDREDVIPGMMAWKDFNTLDLVMSQPALSTRGSPSSSRIDTLPLSAPPPLTELPHPSALMDTGRESVGVLLTPEMIRKQFQSAVALVSNGNLACTGPTGRNQLEAPQRSEVNNMGRRVMARLKQLEL